MSSIPGDFAINGCRCADSECEHRQETKIPYERSFASHEKAKYWHSTKNNNITPREVTKSNGNKYWFSCDECCHDFTARIGHITKKVSPTWCPYCKSNKLCIYKNCKICYDKSFASHLKSKYWHSTRNNNITPREVTKSNSNKYWFSCDECYHDFTASICHITNKVSPTWCPYCSNQKLCQNEACKICFKKSFASHPKANHWSGKNIKTPRDVAISSNIKYLFNCDKCKHSFLKTPGNITFGESGCPYCIKTGCKLLCNDDSCAFCKTNSFASHPKAKCWSKQNKKSPREVTKSNGNKYWFDCDECHHSFVTTPGNINCNGSWCPYCAHQKLCENHNCSFCESNSFASHPKAKFWSKQNKKSPREVSKSNGTKYWFDCDECDHSFELKLSNIIHNDSWCVYCSHKLLCGKETCEFCFNNSFESCKKSKYWLFRKNGSIKPRQVFKFSHKKYYFNCCSCKRDFVASLYHISNGRWCPYCVNKTEAKMKDYLESQKEKLRIGVIIHHFKPQWANLQKTHGTYFEYDFYLELTNEVKIIIEIDGRQHQEKVSNWNIPLHNQIRDFIKESLAGSAEINVIRMKQEDIWEDKNNWQKTLHAFINNKYLNNDIIEIYDACKW